MLIICVYCHASFIVMHGGGLPRARAAHACNRVRLYPVPCTDMMWLAQLLLLVGSAADDAFVVPLQLYEEEEEEEGAFSIHYISPLAII